MESRGASDLSRSVAAAIHRTQHDGTRKRWTVASLARDAGYHYRTLWRKLNGEAELTAADVFTIADAIGVPADELMRDASGGHANVTASQSTQPASVPADHATTSPRADNVTELQSRDWDAYEGDKAADDDVEALADEGRSP